MRRFIRDIQFMIEGVSIGLYWKFCWGIFVPVSLTLILVYSIYQFEWLEYSGVPLPEVYVCKYKFISLFIVFITFCLIKRYFLKD